MRCGEFPQFRGCPRNCKRRILRLTPLGISVLGRRRGVTTRKPGDLPSAVVTREDVGRGVQALASPELVSAQWWDLVRCDVPLTSYRGLNHVLHYLRRRASPCFAGVKFPRPPAFAWQFRCARAANRVERTTAADRGQRAHRREPDPGQTDL